MRVCFDTRERIYIPKDVYEYFKQEITRTIMIIRENFDCKVEYKIVENKQSSTSKHEFGNSGFFQFVNVKDFKQFEKAKSCLLSVIQGLMFLNPSLVCSIQSHGIQIFTTEE